MAESPKSASPLARLFSLHPGEGRVLLWSAAFFFFVLQSYYVLRPLRETMGIARGADKLPWLMTGTAIAMLAAMPLYGWLVSRMPRRRFIPWAYRFFQANLAVFFVLPHLLPEGARVGIGYAYYIWVSFFNLFIVSIFWAFMTDTFSLAQGKRLFGVISVGGTVGTLCGSRVVSLLTGKGGLGLDPFWLVAVSIVMLEASLVCFRALARRNAAREQRETAAGAASREPGPGIFEGLRLVASSRYLGLIAAFMLLFTFTATLLYMEQARIVEATSKEEAARITAFADLDFWTNTLTLVAQLLLAGRLMSWIGVAATLMFMPLITLAGFGALWAEPIFVVVAVFQVVRRGLHYAIDRPVREVLYTILGPDERYKSKSFIDTFVYRVGDMAGAWTPELVKGFAAVGLIAVVASGLWTVCAGLLGREHVRRVRRMHDEVKAAS